MTEPKSNPIGSDFSDLLKRADRLVADIPHQPDLARTVSDVAEVITRELGSRLGVSGGRVYRRAEEGESYQLLRTFGAAHPIDNPPPVPAGLRAGRDAAPGRHRVHGGRRSAARSRARERARRRPVRRHRGGRRAST